MRACMKAFTIIELLIVMGVMLILFAIGFPAYQRVAANSKKTEQKAHMMNVSVGLEQFQTDYSTYPFVGGSSDTDSYTMQTEAQRTNTLLSNATVSTYNPVTGSSTAVNLPRGISEYLASNLADKFKVNDGAAGGYIRDIYGSPLVYIYKVNYQAPTDGNADDAVGGRPYGDNAPTYAYDDSAAPAPNSGFLNMYELWSKGGDALSSDMRESGETGDHGTTDDVDGDDYDDDNITATEYGGTS